MATPDFILDFLIFSFVASLGVLQIFAIRGDRRYSFFRQKVSSTIFGSLLLIISYLWFFNSGQRNVRNLEGAELFIIFGLGAMLSVLVARVIHNMRKAKNV